MEISGAYTAPTGPGSARPEAADAASARRTRNGERAGAGGDRVESRTGPARGPVAAAAPDVATLQAATAERNAVAVVSFAALRDDPELAARYADFARSAAKPPLASAFDRTAAPRFDARV